MNLPSFFPINPSLSNGVTLLAFGNGAPDVFSSLSAAAADTSSQGFYLAAASSLGSSMFVSTIISSVIALLSSKPICVTPQYFVRDVLFYMASISMILYAVAVRGVIDTLSSSLFLCLYAL